MSAQNEWSYLFPKFCLPVRRETLRANSKLSMKDGTRALSSSKQLGSVPSSALKKVCASPRDHEPSQEDLVLTILSDVGRTEIGLEIKLSFDKNMREYIWKHHETCIFALIQMIRVRRANISDFVRWAMNTSPFLVACVASSADRKESDQTDMEMRPPTMFKGRHHAILGS